MGFQLVIQFNSESLDLDFDKLIEIEDILTVELDSVAEVDGHDIGSDEMNIFIYTNDPLEILKQVLKIFSDNKNIVVQPSRIGYRDVSGGDYICIWPANVFEFQVK